MGRWNGSYENSSTLIGYRVGGRGYCGSQDTLVLERLSCHRSSRRSYVNGHLKPWFADSSAMLRLKATVTLVLC